MTSEMDIRHMTHFGFFMNNRAAFRYVLLKWPNFEEVLKEDSIENWCLNVLQSILDDVKSRTGISGLRHMAGKSV